MDQDNRAVFCDSPLWDSNITWYTDDPDFTNCFQKTVLVAIPSAFLWLFLPIQLYIIRNKKASDKDTGLYLFWTKMTMGILLCATSVSELVFSSHGIVVYGSLPVLGYDVSVHQYADIMMALIQLLTYILLMICLTMDWRKRRASNGALFVFWLLMAVTEGVTLRTQLKVIVDLGLDTSTEKFRLAIQLVQSALILLQLILSSFSSYTCNFDKEVYTYSSPERHSPFMSQLLFWWFNRVVYRGWKTTYTIDNLWKLNSREKARNIAALFFKHWNRYASHACHAPLGVVILRAFWVELVFSCLLKLVYNAMVFSVPELLRRLIFFVKHPDEEVWKGYLFAALLLITSMIQTMSIGHYFHRCNILGLRIRTALVGAVYRKVLRTGSFVRNNPKELQPTNLISVDAQRIMDLSSFINQLWEVPLQVGISMYLLHNILGASAFAGLGVMILSIPLEVGIAVWSKRLQVKQMVAKDARVRLTGEIFRAIKLLKLHAWEEIYEKRVFRFRSEELKTLRSISYLTAFSTFYSIISPFIVALATFSCYVLSDTHVLDSEEAFVAIAVFNILKNPMNMLPPTIGNVIQALVAKKRLSSALNADEPKPYVAPLTTKQQPANYSTAVSIRDGFFAWSAEAGDECLSNINLEIPAGKLVGIVGQAGSGKTALCRALLGLMNRRSGVVESAESVVYMPQQAWIQSRSFKDNILFGRSFQKTVYQRVVQDCALEEDIDSLELRDETVLSDQGSNLSGGQQQRLCLARTVYGYADVFVLDDPLSALDAKVAKYVFENVIGPTGLLKDKTRIVVMNGYHFLPYVDHLVVLEEGHVSESGSFQDLLDQSGPFAEFIQTHLRNEIEALHINHTLDPAEAVHRQKSLNEVVDKLPRSMKTSLRDHRRSLMTTHKPKRLSSQISRVDSLEDLHTRLKQVQQNAVREEKMGKARKDSVHGKEGGSIQRAGWKVYWQFMRTVTLRITALVLLTNAASTAFSVSTNIWLSEWVEDKNITRAGGKVDVYTRDMRLGIYGLLGALQGLFFFVSMMCLAFGLTLASRILHSRMLRHLVRAPMWFFDTTPLGRITNRFSKDVDSVDVNVPQSVRQCLNSLFNILGTLAILIYAYPLFSAFMVPIAIVYIILQYFYITTSRQLKQLEAISRSPFFSHFHETLSGASVISIFKQQDRFIKEFEEFLDLNNGVGYLSLVAQRWLSLRLELVGCIIIFITAVLAVYGRDNWDIHPGIVGLSVTYAVQITQVLSWFVQKVSDLEISFVSVERINEYIKCPQEAAWVIPESRPPPDWPASGGIQFSRYKCRYRPGLDLALNGLSCDILPREKIGIVGRTGAGKSSLSLGIFRIIEASEGSIVVDGIDVSKIGLHDLRSRLTIIPQDPLLLSGSLRENLDPSGTCSDEAVWQALEAAHLKNYVQNLHGGLMHPVSEGGSNLSMGQRQLVCLARAILRKTKILILDEATASLDAETDELLQKTIHDEFKDCTMLIIAHRLSSVLECDRVMVLDHGRIEEFDAPEVLLKTANSTFYSLAMDANLIPSSDHLSTLAEFSTSDSERSVSNSKSPSTATINATESSLSDISHELCPVHS